MQTEFLVTVDKKRKLLKDPIERDYPGQNSIKSCRVINNVTESTQCHFFLPEHSIFDRKIKNQFEQPAAAQAPENQSP
jgi:hypothetical protein